MLKKNFKKLFAPIAVGAIVVLAAASLYATKLIHFNAAGMANNAAKIFTGICISATEGTQAIGSGTMYYTEYTFQVIEAIKGVPKGGTVTFRQLGQLSTKKQLILGMPSYVVDKKYMLFLGETTSIGLTSPIGLFQGAFLGLAAQQNGGETFVNGYNNVGLFHGMDANKLGKASSQTAGLLANKKGPVNAADFIQLVKGMVE